MLEGPERDLANVQARQTALESHVCGSWDVILNCCTASSDLYPITDTRHARQSLRHSRMFRAVFSGANGPRDLVVTEKIYGSPKRAV